MKRLNFLILTLLMGSFLLSCESGQVKSNQSNSKETVKNREFNDDEYFISTNKNSAKTVEKKEKEIVKTGYASWYGKELQGKPTASGELFDMNLYTAAHREYPMGSLVLVKNLETGKKQVVKINDRGPYVDGRIIDVSYATARDLGFAAQGTAKVSIEMIQIGKNDFLSKSRVAKTSIDSDVSKKEEKETDLDALLKEDEASLENENIKGNHADRSIYIFADGLRPLGHTVQVGAFHKRSNAERYKEEMEDSYSMRVFIASRKNWHFVWVGDFTTASKAKTFYRKLREKGVDVFFRGKPKI